VQRIRHPDPPSAAFREVQVQTFLSLVMVILIVVGALWLRSKVFGLGNRRPASPAPAAPAYLNEVEYRRLGWELERRGFRPEDPHTAYSDFYFADQLAVEVGPAGAGRFQVNVRNGAGWSSATEALGVARHAR
jgi:hypothetical protein